MKPDRLDSHQGPASGLAQQPLGQSEDIAQQQQNPAKIITVLLDQHDDIIFAYLRLARSLSINHNVPYSPGHDSLSSDQVQAVWVLRDYADDQIKFWLQQGRKLLSDPGQLRYPRNNTLQDPSFAYPTSEQPSDNVHAPSSRPTLCAPSDVVQTKGLFQGTLNPSRLNPHQKLDKTESSREAVKATNLYWCTLCEDRHSFKTPSDWRKHEKGHVDRYVCMLGGPLEQTEGGPKCILCGNLNPSEEHLDAHKIHMCGQGVPRSFICKRRDGLVRHLKKCHGVSETAHGEAIADIWKETTKNQVWSCGFCIHLAYTFGDRLKHIATHFKDGLTLKDWDTTNVIEGLLSHPRMIDAWKIQLDAFLGWEPPTLTWNKHAVKVLQHDLEIGPSDTNHAAALAKAAYEACQSGSNMRNVDKSPAFAPLFGAPEPSDLMSTSNHDPITERALQSNSNHDQSQFVANPAETLHYGGRPLGGVPMASSDYGTFPTSSSGGSTSIKDPWHLGSSQAWSSAVDQNTGSNMYQQYSDATTMGHIPPGSAVLSDEQVADHSVAQSMWG